MRLIERIWPGCEDCSSDYHQEFEAEIIRYHMSDFSSRTPVSVKFCPSCGAPLTADAVDMVMKRLKTLTVSRAVYEQTAWERDIAMEQLAAHGIGFGEECEAAGREGTNCTPAELSEEIGQKKAVAHEAEVYGERMLGFLHSFKTELEKQFGPMESEWDARSRTVGWASALKAASEKHLPEIWALWDALDWWASDLLDNWITDCAVYKGLCKRGDAENW